MPKQDAAVVAAMACADLEQIEVLAWSLLHRALTEPGSAFRTPVLATTDDMGSPQARVVVLRAVERAIRRVRFHTDRRSPKLREIERNPRVAIVGYDAAAKVQIRLSGVAVPHAGDALAAEAWAASAVYSRLCYAQAEAPSLAIAAPGSAPQLTDDSAAAGAANFVAVVVVIDRMDWLYLSSQGHRRAGFTWAADGSLQATWLAP